MRSKQLIFNIVANVLSVLVSLFVSFFLTPYIVTSIGKEAYSFVPISNNFVQYMSILTIALTSMTSRFVTLSLHKDDREKANAYYSTSFFTNLIVATISVAIGIFIVLSLDKIIDIPQNILGDVRLLFLFMFLMFFVNVSTSTFSVPMFSVNRIDITGMVTILSILARLVVIVVTFTFFPPHVYFIGLSILAYMGVQGVLNFIFARKVSPDLKISMKSIRLSFAKELASSGIWNSFNQLSSSLMTGMDLLIANIMLGASAAGTLAVAKTAPMALQMLTNVIPQAFAPHLTITYAKEKHEVFLKELLSTMKITALLTGIPIAGFIALSNEFFTQWVPLMDNGELSNLAILTMISMVASFGVLPLLYLFTITNKLRVPSMVVFALGLLNILVVIVLLNTTDLGLVAIAGISSILESFRYLVFVPIYASHCLNEKRSLFYPSIIRSLVYMVILLLGFELITLLLPAASWTGILLDAFLMVVFGGIVGFLFLLDHEIRNKVIFIFRTKILKHP